MGKFSFTRGASTDLVSYAILEFVVIPSTVINVNIRFIKVALVSNVD